MVCPYCESENWHYNGSMTEPRETWGDGEGYYEYKHAICSDCGKGFIMRDSYELVEWQTSMTIEEYKERDE